MEIDTVSPGHEESETSVKSRTPRIVGYARVSTDKQDHDSQVLALRAEGITEIITETGSGKVTAPKPRRDALLAELESGDTLVIWKFDRIGRSMAETVFILEDLTSRGVTLRSLTEGIDTRGTLGKMLVGIIAGLAELEREGISERTKAGLAAARADGKTLGRPQVITDEDLPVLRDLVSSGRTNAQIARALRVSQSSVVRAKRRLALDGEMAA